MIGSVRQHELTEAAAEARRIVHVEIQSPLYFDPDSYRLPHVAQLGVASSQNTAKNSQGVLVSEAENSCYGTSRTKAQAAGGTEDPCG
jgi:hypothetical protein